MDRVVYPQCHFIKCVYISLYGCLYVMQVWSIPMTWIKADSDPATSIFKYFYQSDEARIEASIQLHNVASSSFDSNVWPSLKCDY